METKTESVITLEPCLNDAIGGGASGVPNSFTRFDDKGRPYTPICSFERVESEKYSVFRMYRFDEETGREYDLQPPEYFELGPNGRRIVSIEDYKKGL